MITFWNWLKSLFIYQPSPIVQPVVNPITPMPEPIAQQNTATLQRTYKTNETLGIFSAIRKDGQTFTCKVLELPWLNNHPNTSCIPAGVYLVEMHPFYDTMMYQIMNVLNRTAIFQHKGNYEKDTEGCQIMGQEFIDINGDGVLDVNNSAETVAQLIAFFGGESYTLTIT